MSKVDNVLIIGYHETAAIELEALVRHGYNVIAVIPNLCRPNQVNNWYRSIEALANFYSVMTWNFSSIKENNDLLDLMEKYEIGVIFSGFSSFIFPQRLISCAKYGCYNFHNSDLPRYRGRAAPIWAKINGETQIAMTLHEISSKVDQGSIIDKEYISVSPQDDMRRIYNKCAFAQEKILDRFLPKLRKFDFERCQQPSGLPGLTWNDDVNRKIEISTVTCQEFVNKVYALRYPFPMAYIKNADRDLLINDAEVLLADGRVSFKSPGTILTIDDENISISLRDGIVNITDVYYQGRFMLPAHLCHILKIKEGDIFGA